MSNPPAEIPPIDPSPSLYKGPLQIPAFRSFLLARFISVLSYSAQSAAIAWHIYETARETTGVGQSALYVGLMGLCQFIAMFITTLPAGVVVDKYDRKKVMGFTIAAQAVIALGFFALAVTPNSPFWALFVLSACLGVTRSFIAPAGSSIGPMIVPRDMLPKAIAINSLSFQVGGVLGPALGGVLVAASTGFAYGVSAVLFVVAGIIILNIKANTQPEYAGGSKMEMVKEGLSYIWTNKVVLGALSLDLFAVLLGGATALLPIFAKDVLHVGPEGYGILRSSAAVGAMATAAWLARSPIRRHAGKWMYGGVAIFGICTIIFGISQSFWVSVAALVVLGAADMVSVYVRGTLVQIVTPDYMRGRVASVSYLFIGASNELGEFESGVVARFLGPVGAALFGGIGSLIVTGAWVKLFPALYKSDQL
ncbi:MFS transporter [Asticcacaulis sp. ZE23SCel15]|uniref:MFS transporter n=1 Tax=Asticcacaulis sp. ZE23SCel15 TaxID=3059027 RepID=UPI00265FF3B2|nr:MFS transporter [Asticcacaulis sp. ZE23SCel15]WKL57799.1 MFS transporter [Asticcacaulis sp. ZE23SCel15]